MPLEKFEYVLPRKMKEILDSRGMTVVRLAKASGVPAKTIYGWMAGNVPKKPSRPLQGGPGS